MMVPSASNSLVDIAAESQDTLLSVRDLTVRFGGVTALDGVSFDIARGGITGLIGPNGAGKTTLFNCLSRLYVPASGDIRFGGSSILGVPAHRVAALGIGRTFQNLASFLDLSVMENIRIGAHSTVSSDAASDMLGLPFVKRRERLVDSTCRSLVEALDLSDVAFEKVQRLPFATRKRVELARALAMRPRLLLLDEPAGGLNHEEVVEFGRLICRLRDEWGITVLIVEHHMGLVMSICQQLVVLNFGRLIAAGRPSEVRTHPEVLAAYLGKGAA
ncbi:ABC transporter ATP-binding protein [Variovorax sp. LARHSF232]